MAAFSHLPPELVEYILSYLAQPHLFAACQLNKGIHALAIPFLYRHVDLVIPPGNFLPRIDRFCIKVAQNARLAARVESLRLGPCSREGVTEGQRWLPQDPHFDDDLMVESALQVLSNETLVTATDHLKDAIHLREYGAYAALVLLILPTLGVLQIADSYCATLDHVYTILRNLNAVSVWNRRRASQPLMQRLSTVKSAHVNVDMLSGTTYPCGTTQLTLEPILNLPCLDELEISIPGQRARGNPPSNVPHPLFPRVQQGRLISEIRSTNITKLIIKHSISALDIMQPLLASTPHLQSFVYDFYHDDALQDPVSASWIDLFAWAECLPKSLTTLVLSIDYCNTAKHSFEQPLIGDKLYGYLDLTNFSKLHTLEVPFPFLTGDVGFSINTDIYPLLPPSLRHLSLRTDTSHAQYSYSLDTSILPKGLSFHESEDEVRWSLNARMDVSYMFHATLILLDFAKDLESISVWQPADEKLSWFDGQVADFAQSCRNRSINGSLVYPMMLRWKSPEHWNLIKEVIVSDPSNPTQDHFTTYRRGQRSGVPLGLGSQYHLHALQTHQVRLRS